MSSYTDQQKGLIQKNHEYLKSEIDSYKKPEPGTKILIQFDQSIEIPASRYRRVNRNYLLVKALKDTYRGVGYTTPRQKWAAYVFNNEMLLHFKSIMRVPDSFNPKRSKSLGQINNGVDKDFQRLDANELLDAL